MSFELIGIECQRLREAGGPTLVLPRLIAGHRLVHSGTSVADAARIHGIETAQIERLHHQALGWADQRSLRPKPAGDVAADDIVDRWTGVHERLGFLVRGSGATFGSASRRVTSRLLPPPSRRADELTRWCPLVTLTDPTQPDGHFEISPEQFARSWDFDRLTTEDGRVVWFDEHWLTGIDAVNAWAEVLEEALRFALVLVTSAEFGYCRYKDLVARVGQALVECGPA